MTSGAILNISCYLFVSLPDAGALRERLQAHAAALSLKGTVLLAEEGINLFLAGPPESVRAWLAELKRDARFARLVPKESWSEAPPFQRLKVKVKAEIIRMNRPAVRPDRAERAPALAPTTLARWLAQGHDDQGQPLVLLDTRNGFEVDHGAFDGAIDWRLQQFSDFPAALAAHRDELIGKTVVSYCTGGIRCEKAAMVLVEQGLTAWQLDGGILKYFEDTEGGHFHGRCFVFDAREALANDLSPAA